MPASFAAFAICVEVFAKGAIQPDGWRQDNEASGSNEPSRKPVKKWSGR